MSRRKGFWSDRPRAGQEDARFIAAERVHELRHLGYAALRARADGATEVEQQTGPSGERCRLRTSIKTMSRGDQEELRILVQVDRGTFLGRLNPLAEELIVATPDGEMTGEYTMAGEGNDPRRYRWPGEGD